MVWLGGKHKVWILFWELAVEDGLVVHEAVLGAGGDEEDGHGLSCWWGEEEGLVGEEGGEGAGESEDEAIGQAGLTGEGVDGGEEEGDGGAGGMLGGAGLVKDGAEVGGGVVLVDGGGGLDGFGWVWGWGGLGLGVPLHGQVEAVAAGGEEAEALVEVEGGVVEADGEAEGEAGLGGFLDELLEKAGAGAVVAEGGEEGDVDEEELGGGAVEEEAAGGDVVQVDDVVVGVGKLGGVAGGLSAVLHGEELV